MAAAETLRRVTLFALLFGGAMGVLVWRAGGFRARTAETPAAGGDPVVHQPTTPLGQNAGVGLGSSEDAQVARDATKVIGGRPVRYRAWTAAWKKSTPRTGPDPDESIQDVESPRIVLYPEPDRADAPPVAAGGPGTTTVTARTGVVKRRPDVRTEAKLAGDVALDHADPQSGDLRLRAPSMDLTMETRDGGEHRHAQSAERVTLDGGKAHLEGTGMDADMLGAGVRVTFLADVKGRFFVRSGSLTGTGTSAVAKEAPTDVTCRGAAELVSLDASPRAANRRYRVTFHDDVRVTQGADTLACDLLEIEFRMSDLKSKDALPAERVVATGNVRINGRTESKTFTITSQLATHTLEGLTGLEEDVVRFEGDPVMNVYGPLGWAGRVPQKTAAAGHGRVEIVCGGPVIMRTRHAGDQPSQPYRTNVLFQKDVVVRQWDDESKPDAVTSRMTAPKATLYGTRVENQAFQPDTLIAEGGVDVLREGFTSHSGAATWSRVAEQGIDRYLLAGQPHVEYTGDRALRPFGRAKAAPGARFVADTADSMRVDLYDDLPSPAGTPPRPYAVVSGGPHAVLREVVAGEDVYRMTAEQIDATIAADRELEHVVAERDAHVWGRGDDGQERDLYGTRILLDREVAAKGAAPGAPRLAQVSALGTEAAPAIAIVREKDGSRHDVRAERLHYEQEGSLLTATGNVLAVIDVKGREDKRGAAQPKLVAGAVRIRAGEARVTLEPAPAEGRPALRRVVATEHVVIDGGVNRLFAEKVDFDAQTGLAEASVQGQNQIVRLVSLMDSERYTSFLNTSTVMRAWFDMTSGLDTKGRLLRALCPDGGLLVRYIDPPTLEGAAVAGETPRRVQIESNGPMELTRTEATATGVVSAAIARLTGPDRWEEEAVLQCSRAHLTFDPDAEGGTRDRIRTFDAQGQEDYPVRVRTAEFTGSAARVDVDVKSQTLRLTSDMSRSVHIVETKTGRQLLGESGVWNYLTKEWAELLGFKEVQ